MKRELFGHRAKKRSGSERPPGKPYNDQDYDHGDEDEESYKYVKSKDTRSSNPFGRSEGAPPGYEGKEHVKYKDPGYSSHHIRFPDDEPHMKSNVSKNEMHEMEDNYHHDVPDQTHYDLEKKIKRARMKMDDPHQEDPKPILGTPVHNVPYRGEKDTTGEEEEGPNDMQMPKEHRKKMIVAVMKKKMNKDKY